LKVYRDTCSERLFQQAAGLTASELGLKPVRVHKIKNGVLDGASALNYV